jgi:hypothetical protein
MLAFKEIWMAKSKQKVGRGFNRTGGFDDDSVEERGASGRMQKKPGTKTNGPRREMRERIEVRNEERSLTRELSDWDSYQDGFDSNSNTDSERY